MRSSRFHFSVLRCWSRWRAGSHRSRVLGSRDGAHGARTRRISVALRDSFGRTGLIEFHRRLGARPNGRLEAARERGQERGQDLWVRHDELFFRFHLTAFWRRFSLLPECTINTAYMLPILLMNAILCD